MASLNERAAMVSTVLQKAVTLLKQQQAVSMRLHQQLDAMTKIQEELALDIEYQEKAQAILLALEEAWRKDFERSVEGIITEGIQLVFGDDSVFKVVTSVKAGASAINFELETPDGNIQNILDSEGASVAQVVSFLLRVLLILSHKPALRKVIILDEPFVGISARVRPNFQTLLRRIVDDTGIQLIMVTHDPSYVDLADIVYEVKKDKGVATVKCIQRREEYPEGDDE